MTELSAYLTSLGVSPLLTGLVIGFFVGLLVRGGARGRSGEAVTVTATYRTEFGGQPRVVVTVNGAPRELDAAQSAAVMSALARSRKIEAIKALREATGIGLKDAKEAAESLQQAQSGRPE